MPEKGPKKRDKYTTLSIILACLVLGIPVAGVAINLESTFFPPVPLKQTDAIINTPHIALFAAAFLSIISCVVVALGAVLLRHVTPNNAPVGLVSFGMAGLNLVAQLVILGVLYISNATHPESKSTQEIKFVNGVLDTSGKQFTHETFACMMGNLYLAQEPWATNACSEYHYARYTTILMVNMGFLLLTIAWWPVRNFLFGTPNKA